MMTKGPLWTVFRKEVKETSRDWKALVITYGMPLIVYPILFVWMAEAVAVRVEKERGETYAFARLGARAPDVDLALAGLERFEESKPSADSLENLEAKALAWAHAAESSAENSHEEQAAEVSLRSELMSDRIQALLLDNRDRGKNIRILYDPSDGRSTRAAQLLFKRFQDQGEKIFKGKLQSLHLSSKDLYPLKAELAMLSGPIRAAAPIYGPFLLSVILMVLCLSAYYPALGATVSERESGTLQTLLSTSARPRDLVLGKFAAVWLSSLLGLTAYCFPALFLYRIGAHEMGLGGESLPIWEIAWLVPALVCLSALLSAVSLALGFLSPKQSVAQAMLSILILLSMLPGLLVSSSDIEPSAFASLVPFVNMAVMAKSLFVHPVPTVDWCLVILSNGCAAALMVAFSCHLLENEARGEPALVRWRKVETGWLREPTADLSLLYYALALGLSFYVSLVLTNANVVLSLFMPQLLILLAAPAFLARGLKLSARETFLLRKPAWVTIPLSACFAVSTAFAMAAVLAHVKLPEGMAQELERKLGFGDSGVPLLFIAAVAIVPALCEEFAFRGLILSGLLRRFSPLVAIVTSAAMFAFMHMSLVRFVPTFVVGLGLGFIAFRTRSLWPGMVAHGVYNLTLILMSRSSAAGPTGWTVLVCAWLAAFTFAALIARATRAPSRVALPSVPERLAS